MTILIADSGSTKTDWIVCNTETHYQARFATAGLNPCLMDDASITCLLAEEVAPQIKTTVFEASADVETSASIAHVHFYGAGCRPDQIERMQRLIGSVLHATSVSVASDLLGAAHALCGHEAGIVAILGTGSGSAVYNGECFTAQTPSLGYILGDEGSGAVLGRRLVGDLYKVLGDEAYSDAKNPTEAAELFLAVDSSATSTSAHSQSAFCSPSKRSNRRRSTT